MLNKKDKQRFLNKFKFIEVMNGYTGTNWWRQNEYSCVRCEFNYPVDEYGLKLKCLRLKKRLCYSFKFNDIKEAGDEDYDSFACVEFLRTPLTK